jgi:hypothetical protein
MLHPNDDLFACGYAEPRSGVVCDVIGIDDLIIVGIIAAASIAASQVSASENESNSNKLLNDQQKQQMKQTELGWLSQRGHDAMAGVAARNHGAGGGASMTDPMQPLIQKDAIDNHYELGRQANARQADATRTQGYIQAGSALASGIAGQALRPATGASTFEAGGGYEGTGAGIADRAGGYDLNQGASTLLSNAPAVATPQLHSTDPNGGYQLQPSDYQTLAGAQPYSQSPFGDDPYATAPQYQNPNRYRFTL